MVTGRGLPCHCSAPLVGSPQKQPSSKETGARDMEIDELVRQRMADLGLTRGQLALRMGWRNPSKGALRIISICKGNTSFAHSRREKLAAGLAVEVEVVEVAIKETVEARGGRYPPAVDSPAVDSPAVEPVKTRDERRSGIGDLRRQLMGETRLSGVLKHNDIFDCALISAVREARNCGKGRAYTKQETLKRNRNLALKLLYSGYAVLSVKGHWSRHQESDTSDRTGSGKYDIMERSFFVLGAGPRLRFERNITELGRYFEQDSVLILPLGSRRSEAKAYLVRTNDCRNSRKEIPGGKSEFESIRLDEESTGWISLLRTGGRPLRLEDEILAHHIPPHGYGNIFLSQEAKRDWKEAESLFLGGFRPESACRFSGEFNYHACGRTDESKRLLERTKEAFEVSEFKEMTGSSKTKHSLDRQGRPQVLLTLEGAFNSADAVHIVCNEADDAFDMTFLSGVERQFTGYDYDVVSEHKGLPFEDIKPVFQEETRFYHPFATKEG